MMVVISQVSRTDGAQHDFVLRLFYFLKENMTLKNAFDGETLRFFMLRTQYRSPFNFSDQLLADARTALRRLYTALDGIVLPAENAAIDWAQPQAAAFKRAMDDDFNTPGALAVLFELANELNRSRSADTAALLRALAATLGVLQQPPAAYLQAAQADGALDEASIERLIAERAAAKAGRNFAEADRIRAELAAAGIELKDSASRHHAGCGLEHGQDAAHDPRDGRDDWPHAARRRAGRAGHRHPVLLGRGLPPPGQARPGDEEADPQAPAIFSGGMNMELVVNGKTQSAGAGSHERTCPTTRASG